MPGRPMLERALRPSRIGRAHVLSASLVGALSAAVLGCGGTEAPDTPARAETPPPVTAEATAPEPSPPPAPAPSPGDLSFALEEENGSATTGRATLRREGGAFVVRLDVADRTRKFQAHIHDVTCAGFRGIELFNDQVGTIVVSLEDAQGGTSITEVGDPLSRFRARPHSINVHAYEEPFDVVACGDVPRSR
jgi:hypothetical protein